MLNKKLLRQYADPGLTIPANHGLLYAEQVRYIIRTAVRIIDHHRKVSPPRAGPCSTPAITI